MGLTRVAQNGWPVGPIAGTWDFVPQGVALVVTHKSELVLVNWEHWGIMAGR
jgi:hypothetical protein